MKLLVLVAAVLAGWVISVPATAMLDGPAHWLAGSIAAVICLLPAIATLLMLTATEGKDPTLSVGVVMIAPLLRIVVVLLAGSVIGYAVPELRAAPLRFTAWLLGFYLLTLIVETALVLPRAMKVPETDRTNGL